MSKAFTLIELLVVFSIIVLMTALTLPNYRLGDNQLAIQRSAHKISQDLRRAQEFAISVKEFNGSVPSGYGIYFDLDQPQSYIMFADLNGDKIYSRVNEKMEEIILEGNVILDSLTPVTLESSMTVFFAPPDPIIQFLPDATTATINIKVEAFQKTIQVNKAGLIAASKELKLTDQCNSSADCDDGNSCINNWCERPTDPDSVCHRDPRPNGTDCGDCKACQSGICTNIPNGQDPNNECSSYVCTNYIYGWSGNNCLKYLRVSSGSGNCCGSGSCCGVSDSCTGAGAVSASCGSSGCKKACVSGSSSLLYDAVDEVCYTSGRQGCSAGYVCDLSGACMSCSVDGDCSSGNCYIDNDSDGYAGSSGFKTCRPSASLGADCDDTSGTKWQNLTCYGGADSDRDSYYAGVAQSICSGTSCPSRYSTQRDCYDFNANARPGQTSYYNTHRGDGSFDYDCDGVETKYPDHNCVANCPTAGCYLGQPTCYGGFRSSVPACGVMGTLAWQCVGYRNSGCTGSHGSNNPTCSQACTTSYKRSTKFTDFNQAMKCK